MIKKLLLILIFLFQASVFGPIVFAEDHEVTSHKIIDKFFVAKEDNTGLPSLQLLQKALYGYDLLSREQFIGRPEVITIIDFSLPSDKERLWVIDLIQAKVLFHCLVSHGRNSGDLMAEYFSNNPGSYASSPGFYSTGETYMGRHGLSLTLNGLEKGINDKARERAIVIHGADYVSPEFIRKHGRLGRSLGCPAIPDTLNESIIETIKGGSCLFIYAPKESYLSHSQIISKSGFTQKDLPKP